MANNQLLASDNFASGSLAAGWSAFSGESTCKVVSGTPNVTEPNSVNVGAGQIWTGLTWPNDQISEVTSQTLTSESSSILALHVRTQAGVQSGYQVNIGAGSATLYRNDAGTVTQLSTVSGLSFVSGDVWSLAAIGSSLAVYQNYKQVLFAIDTTYSNGSPGYEQFSNVNITHTQVSSWRGYSAVQNSGVWKKQGCLFIPTSNDVANLPHFNKGTMNATRVLYEGNAQILSGNVYKIWFATGKGIAYAESRDGLNWTRNSSLVLASYGFPQIFKNGTIYYLYCQPNDLGTSDVALYTSSDGLNWTQQSTTILGLGTAGQWDDTGLYFFCPVYIDSLGTWHAIYNGFTSNFFPHFGLATSSDGLNWTKYAGNPVSSSLSIWLSAPILINGIWYLWGSSYAPGQGGTNPSDPLGQVRIQSTDLITWTGLTHGLDHTQFTEGVNTPAGESYPDALYQVGNTTYMLYDGVNADLTAASSLWQINIATAPGPLSSLVQFSEDAVSQIATDNFTSGTGNLNSNWTSITGLNPAQIVAGNLVEPTVLGTIDEEVYIGAVFSANQYSEVTIAKVTTGVISLLLRSLTGARTNYQADIHGSTGSSNTSTAIYVVVNGSATQLSPTVTVTPQISDVWRFSIVGNVLTLYQNGFVIIQVQDVNNTLVNGMPGFAVNASGSLSNAQVSLWGGGNTNIVPNYPLSTNAWLNPALNTGLRGLRH